MARAEGCQEVFGVKGCVHTSSPIVGPDVGRRASGGMVAGDVRRGRSAGKTAAANGFARLRDRHPRSKSGSSLGAGFRARRVAVADRGALDRKSVVEGKSVSGRVDLGGRRIIKKKNKIKTKN